MELSTAPSYKSWHVSLHSISFKNLIVCEIYEASYSERMYLTVSALPGHVAKSFYLQEKQNKQ